MANGEMADGGWRMAKWRMADGGWRVTLPRLGLQGLYNGYNRNG